MYLFRMGGLSAPDSQASHILLQCIGITFLNLGIERRSRLTMMYSGKIRNIEKSYRDSRIQKNRCILDR